MIQFQTTIIYSSVGEEGEIKTKLYIKSAALQTNMRSSIGLTPLPSHNTDGGKVFFVCKCMCVSVCVCVLHVCVICSRPVRPERRGCPSCCQFQRSWWGHCSGQWALWTWTRRRWLRRRRRTWAEGGCRSLLHLCCEKHTSTNRFHRNTQDYCCYQFSHKLTCIQRLRL